MLKDVLTAVARELTKFVVALLIPIALIFIGAGLFALGVHFKMAFLLWTGGVVALCGVLWGVFLVLWASDG